MAMFGRNLVPISGEALAEIDAQASRSICKQLSARRFVDVNGPHGWELGAVSLGRLTESDCTCADGLCTGVRAVLPLVEAMVTFELNANELRDIDRGAKDVDLERVEKAAIQIAAFEEKIIYGGHKAAGIKGIAEACSAEPIALPAADPNKFLAAIGEAVCRMSVRDSICGPYALVGGCTLQKALMGYADGRTLGAAVLKYTCVEEIIYSPNYDGAFLVSKRGGDFELTLGLDYVVGYNGPKGDDLSFFIGETFAFRVIESRAAVALTLK